MIFCTNVMSGLPLWCTDLRFGLPRASPPLQSPICHSCSLLLDFLASPTTSKSIPPLLLAPFGLPRISPPLQSPIRSSSSPHHAKKADCKAIRQSQSGNSNPPVQSSISQFHQVKHLQ